MAWVVVLLSVGGGCWVRKGGGWFSGLLNLVELKDWIAWLRLVAVWPFFADACLDLVTLLGIGVVMSLGVALCCFSATSISSIIDLLVNQYSIWTIGVNVSASIGSLLADNPLASLPCPLGVRLGWVVTLPCENFLSFGSLFLSINFKVS